MKEEQIKWIQKLQKLLNKQPAGIIGYCTGTEIIFFEGDELPLTKYGTVNGSAEHIKVDSKNWEAGAF